MGTGSSGTHLSQKRRYFKHKMMFEWVPECLSPAFLKSAKQIPFNYCISCELLNPDSWLLSPYHKRSTKQIRIINWLLYQDARQINKMRTIFQNFVTSKKLRTVSWIHCSAGDITMQQHVFMRHSGEIRNSGIFLVTYCWNPACPVKQIRRGTLRVFWKQNMNGVC